jgi:hypothetical protein
MGVVYEARDPRLDRIVALKTVGASSLTRAERKRYEKRFLTEARRPAAYHFSVHPELGRHEVRVRLRSGDDDRDTRSSATFRSGATCRLEVKAPCLRGGLTLEWK